MFDSHVPLKAQTSTWEDKVAEVVRDRGEGVLLELSPEPGEFVARLGAVLLQAEVDALAQRQISPVGTIGGIAVLGADDIVEGGHLVDLHLLEGEGLLVSGLH